MRRPARGLTLACALTGLLSLGVAAAAPAPKRGAAAPGKGRGAAAGQRRGGAPRGVHLDFHRAPLSEIARVISHLARRNIILSDSARGRRVSIFSPRRVGPRQALDALFAALAAVGLTAIEMGRVLVVVPRADARGRR